MTADFNVRFRRIVLQSLIALVASSAIWGGGPTRAKEQTARLNILLFTADDLHAESVGVFAGKPEGLTPNLDRFARQGMLFDHAHVNAAICAPSRAVIGTGLYSHRSGALGFMKANEGVPDVVTTFQRAGYLAGVLGKVGHSSPSPTMQWDYQFDQRDLGNGRNPDIYYQRCVTFFEMSKAAGKPFYFMVNSHDPHRPYCNPEKLTRGAAMPSKTYRPGDVTVPGFLPDLPGVRAELSQYLNSTRRLDDTFGRVMQALEESGFADNTLVVFLSDNGIAVPFAKCNAWFHSTRTPLLVRWPEVIEPGSANRKDFLSGVDLFPTFLDATGVSGPEELDGRSFVPLLKGERQSGRDYVFTQIDKKAGGDAVPMRCVQNAQFGYIYNPFSDGKHWYRNNNEGLCMQAMNEAAETNADVAARVKLFRYRVAEEFYNLAEDPDCLNNLVDNPEYRAAIEGMRSKMQAWMEQTEDPMLPAFLNRSDRSIVDRAMLDAYGSAPKPKTKKPPRASGYHWRQTDDSLALLRGRRIIWQSNHAKGEGKPCLHPVALTDGTPLTRFRPPDHLWHRAVWFTWKYINGLVYWDEDRDGRSPGVTEVIGVKLDAAKDFSARVEIDLSFHPPGKPAVLTEKRIIRFSPPQPDGSYRVDWQGVFTAEGQDAVLDRTPIPGQPGGVGHGGYAGFSVRMAENTRNWHVFNSEGVAEEQAHGQKARWLVSSGTTPSGNPAAIAVFDHPANVRHPSPWYVTKGMPYYSPAVLFNEPLTIPEGKTLTLRYRILIRPGTIDEQSLASQWQAFAGEEKGPLLILGGENGQNQ